MGFLEREGRVYLVRNMMDSSYRPIGVLALALDPDYFFGDLALLPWASAVSVRLEPEVTLTLKGEAPPQPGGRTLEHTIRSRDYTLRGTAEVDYAALLTGAESYRGCCRPWGCPCCCCCSPSGFSAGGYPSPSRC